MSTALVIFSGGQDSTTCLYWAKRKFDQVLAISFNYGQRHVIELESASTIAKLALVKHEIINIGMVFTGLSSLINPIQEVKSVTLEEAQLHELQDTFIPGRNILFLTLAASIAYVKGITDLVIGVSQEDYGGYPDCRLEFINNMERALNSGLDYKLKLHTPLINLNKMETVKLANELPGCFDALAYTTTCYNGVVPPCLSCHACVLRANGFLQAYLEDPLIVKYKTQNIASN